MGMRKCGTLFNRHWWYQVKCTGKYVYEECNKCDERRIRDMQPGVGHQSVDWNWLKTGEWHRPGVFPIGPSTREFREGRGWSGVYYSSDMEGV